MLPNLRAGVAIHYASRMGERGIVVRTLGFPHSDDAVLSIEKVNAIVWHLA